MTNPSRLILNYCDKPHGMALMCLRGDLKKCRTSAHFRTVCQHWVWARRRFQQKAKRLGNKPTIFDGLSSKEICLFYLKVARWSIENEAYLWNVDLADFDLGGLTGKYRRKAAWPLTSTH